MSLLNTKDIEVLAYWLGRDFAMKWEVNSSIWMMYCHEMGRRRAEEQCTGYYYHSEYRAVQFWKKHVV